MTWISFRILIFLRYNEAKSTCSFCLGKQTKCRHVKDISRISAAFLLSVLSWAFRHLFLFSLFFQISCQSFFCYLRQAKKIIILAAVILTAASIILVPAPMVSIWNLRPFILELSCPQTWVSALPARTAGWRQHPIGLLQMRGNKKITKNNTKISPARPSRLIAKILPRSRRTFWAVAFSCSANCLALVTVETSSASPANDLSSSSSSPVASSSLSSSQSLLSSSPTSSVSSVELCSSYDV